MADQQTALQIRNGVNAGLDDKLQVKTLVDGDVVIKLVDKDGVNQAAVTGTNALKVDGSAVTQPVSAGSLPLPTGAATEATLAIVKSNQTDGTQKSKVVDGAGNVLAVTGTGDIGAVLKNAAGTELKGQKPMASSLPVVIASDQTAIPVSIPPVVTTPVHSYATAAAVAKDAITTFTYTNVAATTFKFKQVFVSASGETRIEVKSGAVGLETVKAVGFTSKGSLALNISFAKEIDVLAGEDVLVKVTNHDAQAMDIYQFINGEII